MYNGAPSAHGSAATDPLLKVTMEQAENKSGHETLGSSHSAP
jgi:hypothetical protein